MARSKFSYNNCRRNNSRRYCLYQYGKANKRKIVRKTVKGISAIMCAKGNAVACGLTAIL